MHSNVHTLLEDTKVCVCDVNVCLPRRQKRRQNIGKRLLPLIPASNFPAAVLYTIQSHWDSMGRPGLRHSQHPASEREVNRGFTCAGYWKSSDTDCRLQCIRFNRVLKQNGTSQICVFWNRANGWTVLFLYKSQLYFLSFSIIFFFWQAFSDKLLKERDK